MGVAAGATVSDRGADGAGAAVVVVVVVVIDGAGGGAIVVLVLLLVDVVEGAGAEVPLIVRD